MPPTAGVGCGCGADGWATAAGGAGCGCGGGDGGWPQPLSAATSSTDPRHARALDMANLSTDNPA